MWQKCPVCEGTGTVYDITEITCLVKCSVCNGTKIINEITGLPPLYIEESPINIDEMKELWCNSQKSK